MGMLLLLYGIQTPESSASTPPTPTVSTSPTRITDLRNGIYRLLTTCGPFDQSQVSACDYRVIEQSSGCAIIYHFGPDIDQAPNTFGGTGRRSSKWATIKFTGEGYLRYTGDDQAFLTGIYTFVDDVVNTFDKDETLQGSACFGYLSEVKYNIDEGYEAGGKDWGVIRFIVTIHDLPG